MTFFEFVQSRFYIIKDISRHRSAYKNYIGVIYRILRNKYPINVVLKNGDTKILNNRIEVYTTSLRLDKFFHVENNCVIIFKYNKKIQFFDAISNGDLYGIFHEYDYKFLPVKNKIVLDIGANIGDSAIYFAINNASKVIALEPYQNNFEIAKKNISINNFDKNIELLLAGCSGKSSFIRLDSDKGTPQTRLRESKTGAQIPLHSLEYLVEHYDIESGILKMDCEGCEYDSILETPNKILKKFSHIQVEYHYGYKNLKVKLEQAGFSIETTKPSFNLNYEASPSKMFIGFLYATNTNNL